MKLRITWFITLLIIITLAIAFSLSIRLNWWGFTSPMWASMRPYIFAGVSATIPAIALILVNMLQNINAQKIAQERGKLDRELAVDKRQGDDLQMYLDRMNDLLLKENLTTSGPEEVWFLVRARTLAVLRNLDSARKVIVFQFLQESSFIQKGGNSLIRRANLSKTDLSGATIRESDLSEANLSEANLSEANLSEANLEKSDFQDADLSKANLRGANLRGANLRGANLGGARLREAELRGADLTFANLRGAELSRVELRGTNLTFANFIGADLRGANFIGADLRGANFIGADLRGANLTFASLIETNLTFTNLRKANLKGANLSRANLSRARLRKIKSWHTTNLRGVKGLTKKQCISYETKGAIIDEGTTTNTLQPTPPTSTPSSVNDAQPQPTSPIPKDTTSSDTNGFTPASFQAVVSPSSHETEVQPNNTQTQSDVRAQNGPV